MKNEHGQESLFNQGDFVFKENDLVVIDFVRWNEESKAFLYGILYTQGTDMMPCRKPFVISGGASFSWSEKSFTPITNPILLLRLELTKQNKIVKDAEYQIGIAKKRIESLNYSLETIIPDAVQEAVSA